LKKEKLTRFLCCVIKFFMLLADTVASESVKEIYQAHN
jgi:hypothetical protein